METASTQIVTAPKPAIERPVQASSLALDSFFETLIKDFAGYTRRSAVVDKNNDTALIRKAYAFAAKAHAGQLRMSGDPYVLHCLETAKILTELRMDAVTITAGLIHDVVEDAGIPVEAVREEFGSEVALLVDGVSKISELKFRSQAEKQAENFRKMIFSMAQDLRVILIKFADRLHNMRTLEHLSPKKARRIAVETLEVYAPLAHRFGIARIKWELEDLALKILEPEIYADLSTHLVERSDAREQYIKQIADPVHEELAKENIQSDIKGRIKSLYSIYRKMTTRGKPFEEIFDILAVRIIVKRVDECYFALGTVHTLFVPVHDRFKDYIATPKLNMYQSLHTTVIGPGGRMVEIQIRTEEMHRIAEIGIAAHWKYKESKRSDDELDRYSAWLQEMIDWQKDTLDPKEYMDILKTDLFQSEVFIFTPKGDLFKLPMNSTPVDFAFAVHSDIGMHCIGAKVNGRIVTLNTHLKSGDSVEIITSTSQSPHQDWLTFVKTSKAKSKIKHWLKDARLLEAIKLGEEILVKSLKRFRINASKDQLKALAPKFGKSSLEQLYAEIGQGDLSVQKVAELLVPDKLVKTPAKEETPKSLPQLSKDAARGIRVQGMDHLLIRYAQCCHPVPGDPIVGYITKGRGIVIHRRDCLNAVRLTELPERVIDVEWDAENTDAFMVQLRVLAEARKDFLKDMSEFLASLDISVIRVDMKTENALIHAYLILEVKDLSQLTKIMRRFFRLKGILSVERDSGVGYQNEAS